MVTFFVRRTLIGAATLLVSLYIMYLLASRAADPLADLRETTGPDVERRIAQRVELLNLDRNVNLRFVDWLTGFLTGDPGVAWRTGQEVGPLIRQAMGSTLELVTAATFIALLLGVLIGIVSALRQYSTFDYLIIFVSFVLFSLPVFWVAVLLKQWGAIGYNDFLRDPTLPWPVLIAIAAAMALVAMLALGGRPRRRLAVFGVALAASVSMLAYLQLSNWWNDPRIEIWLVALLGGGLAVAVTAVFAGLHNRRALLTSLTVVVIGLALYYPIQRFFDRADPFQTNGSGTGLVMIAGLAVLTVVVGGVVGRLFGGPDRGMSIRLGAVTAFGVASLIFVDQVFSVWGPYSNFLRGRPMPTFGDRTPNLGGNFWVGTLDSWTHLLLPTVALTLIGFAAYTRYSRGSMLETMNQDYVRTARAKGLPERVVIVRHAFRNTLIPLATIVPIDIITLIGGATITETIFARPGMGALFVQSLRQAEIDPVMAYLVITGALAIVANIVADVIYAAVDPRIRLEA